MKIFADMLLNHLKIPIIGCIPKNNDFSIESRHLGLIPTVESKSQTKMIMNVAKKIADFIDVSKLIQICKNIESLPKHATKKSKKSKITIGVALDGSFNFYYQENLENLRREGAKIKFFSPINDSKLQKYDGLYIGGGFPEIQGQTLARNQSMKKLIKKFAEDEKPIYGECGGLMYLTNSITYDSKNHKMVGIFDAHTHMTKKMRLNYTKSDVLRNCLVANKSKNSMDMNFIIQKSNHFLLIQNSLIIFQLVKVLKIKKMG